MTGILVLKSLHNSLVHLNNRSRKTVKLYSQITVESYNNSLLEFDVNQKTYILSFACSFILACTKSAANEVST